MIIIIIICNYTIGFRFVMLRAHIPSGNVMYRILFITSLQQHLYHQFTKAEFDFNAVISSVSPCNATTTLGVLCASRLPWPNLPKAPDTTGHNYSLRGDVRIQRNHLLQDPNFNINMFPCQDILRLHLPSTSLNFPSPRITDGSTCWPPPHVMTCKWSPTAAVWCPPQAIVLTSSSKGSEREQLQSFDQILILALWSPKERWRTNHCSKFWNPLWWDRDLYALLDFCFLPISSSFHSKCKFFGIFASFIGSLFTSTSQVFEYLAKIKLPQLAPAYQSAPLQTLEWACVRGSTVK